MVNGRTSLFVCCSIFARRLTLACHASDPLTACHRMVPYLLDIGKMTETKEITRTYQATLEDGSQVSYILRGLEEDEIKPWATFCASIFAYKTNPPPPEYFERHFYNDPLRRASLIRVALTMDSDRAATQIVASCRVFERFVSDGKGGSIRAGGIGEVCTNTHHRRRGLSKELLRDCIDIMEESGMKASILHAAPTFFPVYRSMGYQCTKSEWSLLDVSIPPTVVHEENNLVREAVFPDDTATLMALHQSFSETKFVGCIVRYEDYWNTYLSNELKGSLFVLEDPSSKKPFASLSVRPRGDRWQLREFSYSENSACSLSQAMRILLRKTLSQALSTDAKKLHLPTFLEQILRQDRDTNKDWISWDSVVEENDEGWMYRPIGAEGISVVELSQTCPHLIWPADSF